MKRFLSLTALILALALLSGCSMKMEAKPMIDDMLEALAGEDIQAALALLHPSLHDQENIEASVQRLAEYLGGRVATKKRTESFQINKGTGSNGKFRTETGVVVLTLDDESTATLEFVYLSDSEGEGFTGFHITFQRTSAPM